MDQKFIIAASSSYLVSGHHHQKLLTDKGLLPVGHTIGFLNPSAELQVKFDGSQGRLMLAEDAKIEHIKDTYCLKFAKTKFEAAVRALSNSTYTFIVFEGSPERATVVICFSGESDAPFETMERENPVLRLATCDLPPATVTPVDVPVVANALYAALAAKHPHLFSLAARRFLSTPHILTHLFAHVMAFAGNDNVNYISTLRIISDQLRSLLKPRIKKIERNHNRLWSTFYGEKVAFLDGGMSRIVGLPGTEPIGIRVGIYAVTPGETDLEKREVWNLQSYVIGDVVNDRSIIAVQNYRTDAKRLQEAARYILEPLIALLYADSLEGHSTRLLLLHGPLQNPFMVYDEEEPSYIPGVSKEFLAEKGITEESVRAEVAEIPKSADGRLLWSSCIPIYLYIMKRLWKARLPIAGVVERAGSTAFARTAIESLVQDGVIPDSTGRKLQSKILQYEMGDELLFGCILEEGEYLTPLNLKKNFTHRAHDRWKPVVDQFPQPAATMIKCSATNFPYRVEMPVVPSETDLENQMSLLYHMSLLLPNYAFPVGIDIADKYVKIPDWLSRSVSERLTAGILKKVLEKGDKRMLMQVRRLLALSPRDFFFRPRA